MNDIEGAIEKDYVAKEVVSVDAPKIVSKNVNEILYAIDETEKVNEDMNNDVDDIVH